MGRNWPDSGETDRVVIGGTGAVSIYTYIFSAQDVILITSLVNNCTYLIDPTGASEGAKLRVAYNATGTKNIALRTPDGQTINMATVGDGTITGLALGGQHAQSIFADLRILNGAIVAEATALVP